MSAFLSFFDKQDDAQQERDRRRQAAILSLWEAYDLTEDDAAKKLIVFAIIRIVG